MNVPALWRKPLPVRHAGRAVDRSGVSLFVAVGTRQRLQPRRRPHARFVAFAQAAPAPAPMTPAAPKAAPKPADAQAEQKLGALRQQLKSFGRDPATFGIEGWLRMHSADPQDWAAAADGWRRLGADMVMLYPMYRISSFRGLIDTLRRFKRSRADNARSAGTPVPETSVEARRGEALGRSGRD